MDKEFTCPECGSHYYGSTNCTGPGPMVRHCHGVVMLPDGTRWSCKFNWPEKDDHRYGLAAAPALRLVTKEGDRR